MGRRMHLTMMRKSTVFGLFIPLFTAFLIFGLFCPKAEAAISAAERQALIDLYDSTNGDSWADNSGWKVPPVAADGFSAPGTEGMWYGVTTDAGNNTVLEIDLSSNNLIGELPTTLVNLANLERLVLNSNQLTGSIPTNLTNLTNLTDNNSDFRWNALYTDDNTLRTFLNSKQAGGDWESTQTIAPLYPGVTGWGLGVATVEWVAIPYTGDTGGYQLEYALLPGGPWTPGLSTGTKSDEFLNQGGLDPDRVYYFRMQTVTYSHANNPSDVYSEYSPVFANIVQCDAGDDAFWSDNFNGGAQQTWGTLDKGDNSTWEFINNEYELRTENIGLSSDRYIWSGVEGCVSDAVITSQVLQTAPTIDFVACVFLRGDPLTDSGYGASISSWGNLHITKRTNGANNEILVSAMGLIAVPENCWIKFAAIGDTLYAKAWEDGDPEPASWDLQTTDTDFQYGHAGILLSSGSSDLIYFSPSQAAFDNVTVTSLTPSSERQALIDLFNSTDGDNWNDNSGWKDGPLYTDGFAMPGTEGSWYGITTDAGFNTVLSIGLNENNLVGTIPPSIANLSNLTILRLYRNALTGNIPSELGSLSNLLELHLDENSLSGSIPSQLGSLTDLEILDIYDNQLTGSIPPELGGMTSLEELHLDSNNLSGNIPPELGNLANLLELNLDDNQLTGAIPVQLGNFNFLEELTLSQNQLSGSIPPELGNLSFLEALLLNGNQLQGPIPANLINLTGLINNDNDFRWNALYTNDNALRTFLNTKQDGGDWESTQTIAPPNLGVDSANNGTVSLSWDAIAYMGDTGGYSVHVATDPAGPWSVLGATGDKTTTTLAGGGLAPGRTYYFRVQTITNAHADNQNVVYSQFTPVVSAWMPRPTYTVTFSSGTGGSVAGETSQSIVYGNDCTPVTAEPAAGYEFAGWSGDYTGTVNPLTVTNVTRNMTITANFSMNTHTITFTASAGGTVTGDLSQAVTDGSDSAQVTAVPSEGYEFTGWTGDYTGTANPLTLTNVTAGMTITANFKLKTYTVTFEAADNGSLTGELNQTVTHGGNTTPVTASPAECYTFTGWAGDYAGADNPLILTGVTEDMTVTPAFSKAMYTVVFNAEPGGSLVGAVRQSVECGQDATPVEAVPKNENFVFKNWAGDFTGAQNPLTIPNVTRDLTVTAHFIDVTNQPPVKPELKYPSNNLIIPEESKEGIELQWSPYVDPEADPLMRMHILVTRKDDPSWYIADSFDTEVNSYQLPDELEAGLRYEWRVGYQDVGSESVNWSDVREFGIGKSILDQNLSVEPGLTMADYRMVSIVQWPDHSSARLLFGPLLTTDYHMGRYRLGRYDPALGGGDYMEFPNFGVAPGQAFWVLAADGIDFAIQGVPVSMKTDVNVQLKFNDANQSGWNMIGCPNKAIYHWGDVEVVMYNAGNEIVFGPMPISFLASDNPYIDKRIWEWQRGVYTAHEESDFTLLPYAGYWVKALQAGVALCFPFDMQVEAPEALMQQVKTSVAANKEIDSQRLPTTVTAQADIDGDTPPMPMGDVESDDNGIGSSSNCFIEVGSAFSR